MTEPKMYVEIDVREQIYRALRDYQDGKMDLGYERAGLLDAPLTVLFDRLTAIVLKQS